MDFIWETGKKIRTSITEQIKINREISQEFLEASFDKLPDINLLKDLQKAAERIIEAVRNKERIMIYGHDDMDGITATYVLFDYLEKIGSQYHYYHIPNRIKESHGIKDHFINKLKKKKIDLLVTVDGGISEFEAVDKIKQLGCDVIITDHHIVQHKVPDACCVVNPKQEDCDYPFDMLAGVAISYFLVKKLSQLLNIPEEREYLFWVSVGSISDKVPMRGVNRILIKKVLDEWSFFSNEKLLHFDSNFNSVRSHTGRMNVIRNIIKILSSSRDVEGNSTALHFMLDSNHATGPDWAELFDNYSQQEQKLYEIKQWLNLKFTDKVKDAFVYYDIDDNIPIEYLGMCASHISKTYLIPAVFLKKKNDIVACEARCTEGFNLIDAFYHCSDILIQYGGHKQAAGFTVEEKDVLEFIVCFNKYLQQKHKDIADNRKLIIDAVINNTQIDELEQFFYTDYQFFQPYGEKNQSPLILLTGYSTLEKENTSDLIKFKDNFDPEKSYDLVLQMNNSFIKVLDYKIN